VYAARWVSKGRETSIRTILSGSDLHPDWCPVTVRRPVRISAPADDRLVSLACASVPVRDGHLGNVGDAHDRQRSIDVPRFSISQRWSFEVGPPALHAAVCEYCASLFRRLDLYRPVHAFNNARSPVRLYPARACSVHSHDTRLTPAP